MPNYWLMKSEPATFSIDDLATRPNRTEPWDGVRNYQASHLMRDRMQPGDPILFYHSSCAMPGAVGIAEVASAPYPDPTAFDPHSKYYDANSNPAQPRWHLVEVRYVRHLRRVIRLIDLRRHASGTLAGLPLMRRGNRLSIMPVTPEQWDFILRLEERPDAS